MVPEKNEEYEDPNFHIGVFPKDDLLGEPFLVFVFAGSVATCLRLLRLKSGDVVVSIRMPKPGICEILLPDPETVVKCGYVKYRWPPQARNQALAFQLPANRR